MSLLAILISLTLEKLLPPLHGLRSLAWIETYHQWLRTRLANHEKWQGLPTLLIIILLPIIGVGLIQYLLNDLLVFLGFVFSIVILTYCLGPEDRHQLMHQYVDAQDRDDTDTAQATLEDILPKATLAKLPEDKTARTRRLVEFILIQTHEQLLAILFWFIILGPIGAVLYRLSVALQQAGQDATDMANAGDQEFQAAVTRLHQILAWIPAHLAALSYAVMGSFVHALRVWQNGSLQNEKEDNEAADNAKPASHELLIRIGFASLQFDGHSPNNPPQEDSAYSNAIRETLGLCGRSLVAWITILALMTLAGWAS